LEYDSQRWRRAFSFPSHAANRRSTGPPTEAHAALLTEVDAVKRLQAETAAELEALLTAILDCGFNGEL